MFYFAKRRCPGRCHFPQLGKFAKQASKSTQAIFSCGVELKIIAVAVILQTDIEIENNNDDLSAPRELGCVVGPMGCCGGNYLKG